MKVYLYQWGAHYDCAAETRVFKKYDDALGLILNKAVKERQEIGNKTYWYDDENWYLIEDFEVE